MAISYVIVTVIDTAKTFKNKEYKKLAVYYTLILISLSIGILIGLDIKVPSPADSIEKIVKAITAQ
jgi:hypothetical protein